MLFPNRRYQAVHVGYDEGRAVYSHAEACFPQTGTGTFQLADTGQEWWAELIDRDLDGGYYSHREAEPSEVSCLFSPVPGGRSGVLDAREGSGKLGIPVPGTYVRMRYCGPGAGVIGSAFVFIYDDLNPVLEVREEQPSVDLPSVGGELPVRAYLALVRVARIENAGTGTFVTGRYEGTSLCYATDLATSIGTAEYGQSVVHVGDKFLGRLIGEYNGIPVYSFRSDYILWVRITAHSGFAHSGVEVELITPTSGSFASNTGNQFRDLSGGRTFDSNLYERNRFPNVPVGSYVRLFPGINNTWVFDYDYDHFQAVIISGDNPYLVEEVYGGSPVDNGRLVLASEFNGTPQIPPGTTVLVWVFRFGDRLEYQFDHPLGFRNLTNVDITTIIGIQNIIYYVFNIYTGEVDIFIYLCFDWGCGWYNFCTCSWVPYWCVQYGTGTGGYQCVQSFTEPAGAISGPWDTPMDCWFYCYSPPRTGTGTGTAGGGGGGAPCPHPDPGNIDTATVSNKTGGATCLPDTLDFDGAFGGSIAIWSSTTCEGNPTWDLVCDENDQLQLYVGGSPCTLVSYSASPFVGVWDSPDLTALIGSAGTCRVTITTSP